MLNDEKKYIAVCGDNEFEYLQLILLGWVEGLKMFVIAPGVPSRVLNISKHIFFIGKYIGRSIREFKTYLGDYKGLWYEVNKEAIDLTKKFYEQEIRNKSKVVDYYNRVLNTDKFEAYIKKNVSCKIFSLLRSLHLVRLSSAGQDKILMIKDPISKFVIKYMENKYEVEYRIRWISSVENLFSLFVYYGWVFMEFIRRGVVFNKDKKNYKMSKEAVWGFHRPVLRDDMAIDNERFKVNDMLMLDFGIKDSQRCRALKESKKKGFDVTYISKLKINVNGNIFKILFFYFFVPIKIYVQLLFQRQLYLFHYIFLFHRKSFPIEVLMNLHQIGCHISSKDWGDVVETVIFNKYGTKNILCQWSDLTFYKAYNHAFIAHDVYFMWGDMHHSFHSDNHFGVKKINIGCIYKKGHKMAVSNKKNILRDELGFGEKKKTVAFFDTSFNDSISFTNSFFLECLEIIKEFCEANKDINVVLKPKNESNHVSVMLRDDLDQYKKTWEQIVSFDNFTCLDPLKWNVEDVIAMSDVCVTMGMTTPSTVALICRENALYFDNTGNCYHPFIKKYKNVIAFDNKVSLFRQIDNILNERFTCKDIISEREIREYDAFSDSDALERFRNNMYELTV